MDNTNIKQMDLLPLWAGRMYLEVITTSNIKSLLVGEYTVTLRPKLAGGSSQFQNNVCTFEQKITMLETTTSGASPTLTLTKNL